MKERILGVKYSLNRAVVQRQLRNVPGLVIFTSITIFTNMILINTFNRSQRSCGANFARFAGHNRPGIGAIVVYRTWLRNHSALGTIITKLTLKRYG